MPPAVNRVRWPAPRPLKVGWGRKSCAGVGGIERSSQRRARGDHGGRVPPLLFCSAVFDTTNFSSRSAPQACYTRPVRCPTAPRHGPGGPWQQTARKFARYGPGWRGGSSAGQPSKAPRWTVAMGARAGSPRRTAPISAFSRDGTGQPVVGASSGKKGAFRKARAPPRQRSARPVCSTR